MKIRKIAVIALLIFLTALSVTSLEDIIPHAIDVNTSIIPEIEVDPYEGYLLEITSAGSVHDGGLRVGENGEILFSPYISRLRTLVTDGADLSEYSVQLTFILMNQNKQYWAYPTVTLPIADSGDDWFDIQLQGPSGNCGFCPTVNKLYTIEVTVLKNQEPCMQGVWKYVRAAAMYEESAYYVPTAIPTEEERRATPCTIRYPAQEGGTVEGETEQNLYVGATTTEVTAIAKDGYLFAGWSDGVVETTRDKESFVRDTTIYAKFVKIEFDTGIANMYIMVEGGNITSKRKYVDATISIMGAAKEKYNVTLTTQIRGRGNSTFYSGMPLDSYDSKNSYRLKLTEQVNLLGVGDSENRDWVLNANKYDASNLRNYFIWNLANQMQTMSFVPGCTWVNVYLNGDYRGLYMLTEHVEVANDRVEVDDSGTDPDKGYLVELDFRADSDGSAVEGLDYFYIPGFYDTDIEHLREWMIKSEVNSKEETEFIRDYFIRCHEAIMSGDRDAIDALVDIPSLIDMFIIEELSRDVDVSATSQFWMKEKGGKLYFTAPWDYDAGFGTYTIAQYLEGFICEETNYGNKPNLWLNSLIQQRWFRIELYARMREVSSMIETAKESVLAVASMLKPAAEHNDERWNIFGRKYHSFVHDAVSLELADYDAHVEFLVNWIDIRWEWMMQEMWSRLTK